MNSSFSQENGKSILEFTRTLTIFTTNAKSIDPVNDVTFIWAIGTSNSLQDHQSEGNIIINLSTGKFVSGENSYVLGHGALMFIAWGFTFIVGSIIPRYFRNVKNCISSDNVPAFWFRLHQGFQGFGFLLMIIAFILIIVYTNKSGSEHFDGFHSVFGLAIFILSFLQPIGAMCRPKPPSKGENKTNARRFWELFHHWTGRILIICGMVNIFFGITYLNFESSRNTFYGFLLAIWSILVLYISYQEYYLRKSNEKSEKLNRKNMKNDIENDTEIN
jgi:hypothetical protein